MKLPPNPVSQVLLAISALFVSSCVAPDPYTGESELSKTTIGAGTGAAAGAAIGAIIGNNTGSGDAEKGALIGAIAGGLGGAAIDHYMDRQEAAIRARLQGTGVGVVRQGNNLILTMPHDITFDVDRDQIRPAFHSVLDSVAIVLREYNRTLVEVNGHTDSDGSAAYNRGLSLRRAHSVSGYLAGRGVDPRRLIPRGFGEAYPVASNSTSQGKALNRRVEIRIVPRQ